MIFRVKYFIFNIDVREVILSKSLRRGFKIFLFRFKFEFLFDGCVIF